MRQRVIYGDEPFQVDGQSFGVVSPDAITLNYSADGETWTEWDNSTPAGENLQVINFALGTWFKLAGNTEAVVITY